MSDRELQKTIERFNYIISGAGLGSWDWWLKTNAVTFDHKWSEMIGLTPQETPQHLLTWESRVHPDDLQQCYKDIKAYLDGKTSVYENVHRMKHKNGSWVWILDRGRISERDENGDPVRFTGTHFDITEQKKLEAQLEEAQKVAKIGSWSFDLKTQKIYWSKYMFEIFDEKIENGPPSFEKHKSTIHPDDADMWEKTVQQCAQDGKPYRMRFRSMFPDKFYYVEAIGQGNYDEKGNIVSLSGTCQNITEKVLIENELEQQRLKTIHTAKLASLGEMSAGIAHEINNPMAIISSALPLLSKYKDNQNKFDEKISVIEKAILRVTKIVNGLRRFARTGENIGRNESSVVNIINEAMIILEPRAKRFSVTISCDFQSDGNIVCDPLEIEQAIINIVNNAIDAAAVSEPKQVRIQVVSNQSHIFLRVFDSGAGVTKETESKLFQPFFTTKPVGVGTGLGLSITKGILDNHNAEIKLNRTFKETCFEVIFKKV